MSFAANDPPNAAFVIDRSSGVVTSAVLELSALRYDLSGQSLTYTVRLLAAGDHIYFDKQPLTSGSLLAMFDSVSLFTDTLQRSGTS